MKTSEKTAYEEHWREEAVYHFECSLIGIHTETVKRLLSWNMPEEYLPVCTGARPLWCEYILKGINGELPEE